MIERKYLYDWRSRKQEQDNDYYIIKSVLYSYILFLSCIIINGRDIAPHAPSDGKCKDNEYKRHNLCPGTYASRLCDSKTNTRCTPCGSGTFTSRNNHLPACLSCNGRRDRVTLLTIESVNALPDIIVFSKDHPDARHVFPKQNVE
ncbi:TNF receptor CrmB [Vaccinia virus]|uniref:TNF receptor CrmB n=1 Tax=Vaccinia virus TaxID=10245 RepID=M9WJW3_VACCV|nr:TNF-alpha-receptor CrmB [Vaccinia virus]AGJ91959.1 TNF receptor CrmB [Vaccinia virus]